MSKYVLKSLMKEVVNYTGKSHEAVAKHWAAQRRDRCTTAKVTDRETGEVKFFHCVWGDVEEFEAEEEDDF